MDLKVLKSLVDVVDEGSIAAAASRGGITASAVSQRLQALEAELQLKLLLRSGRNVRPTPACVRLLPQIRQLLKDGRALEMSLSHTTHKGRFRLGAVSTALTDYIPRIIQGASQQMPDVELTVHPGTSVQLYRAFQDGEYDAVLCVAPPFELPKSKHFEPLVHQPIGLIGVPRSDAKFIVYNREAWGGAACWRAVKDHNDAPDVLCELDALETIAILVQSGLGIAMLPRWQGLSDRFPDLEFTRTGTEFRTLGLLCRSHEIDHPMMAILIAGFESD